ncbi:MAG: hypothetical protein JXQ72_00730 [Anaerolineae bacterium]|nr:hypothetical protein [Anaerolineae bacterium]
MSGYTYEDFRPHEPIVIYTALEGWSDPETFADSDAEGNAIILAAEQPIYWMLDISGISLDIANMIMLANEYGRGRKSMWHHPNIRQLCIITQDDLVVQMASGVNTSEVFGNLNIKVFTSREEALVFARAAG